MTPRDNTAADVTDLLAQASGGNRQAFDQLLPHVYDELRALARAKLRAERAGHTLNATALVHEAYVRLIAQDRVEWQSRVHFFAVASQAMRRILINYARARNAEKRGGGAQHVELNEAIGTELATELVALDDALQELETFNERGARVVEYRFFGGLTHDEIAQAMGLSEATVRRAWRSARAWLRDSLAPTVRLSLAGDGMDAS